MNQGSKKKGIGRGYTEAGRPERDVSQPAVTTHEVVVRLAKALVVKLPLEQNTWDLLSSLKRF